MTNAEMLLFTNMIPLHYYINFILFSEMSGLNNNANRKWTINQSFFCILYVPVYYEPDLCLEKRGQAATAEQLATGFQSLQQKCRSSIFRNCSCESYCPAGEDYYEQRQNDVADFHFCEEFFNEPKIDSENRDNERD